MPLRHDVRFYSGPIPQGPCENFSNLVDGNEHVRSSNKSGFNHGDQHDFWTELSGLQERCWEESCRYTGGVASSKTQGGFGHFRRGGRTHGLTLLRLITEASRGRTLQKWTCA